MQSHDDHDPRGLKEIRFLIKELLFEAKLQPGQEKMQRDEALLLAWDIINLLGLTPIDPDDVDLDFTWQPNIGIPIGSIRRHKAQVGDIDIVVTSSVDKSRLALMPGVSDIRGGQSRIDFKLSPIDSTGIIRKDLSRSINIMVSTDPDAWGPALMTWTGPASYNMRLRAILKKSGWKMSQNGIIDPSGKKMKTPTERSVMQKFGWTEREPSSRH